MLQMLCCARGSLLARAAVAPNKMSRAVHCPHTTTVHIRPECESIYCAGTTPTGATSQEEQETSDNMHRALIKTWDARAVLLISVLLI
jgi:hypothetical protein